MKQVFLKRFLTVVLGIVLFGFYMPHLSADETSQSADTIDMVAGDIQSVPVNGLTRVSVTNPDVADISDAESDKVSLLAKKGGVTVLFLWDADGKRSVKIRVASEDLDALKARVEKLLQEANVTGVSLEENLDVGKVVLSGELSKDDKNRMTDILQPYSDNLMNLVKEEKSEDLIQVDMQIVEISTSLEKNLGILWGTSSSANTGGIANPTFTSSSNNSSTGVQLGYGEHQPTGDSFADLFKIGNFQRQTPLEATVNALVQEGKAKLISKPRLVVVSGKQASFLVGGEIPVENTTTSASGGVQQSSTTYSQYGVNMSVTPTIREGKIDVLLNVDIRDIDASNSSNGNVAFITRTATTNLFMDNKQTIVLAGLIKYTSNEQITEVPFLSKIPVVGALFRNRATPTPDSNTEMVIILTPTVMTDKKFEDKQIVMPTPSVRDAYRNFDSRYEHEPLPSWQPKAATTVISNDQSSDIVPATTAYARMVQEKISKAIAYPQQALGEDLAGTVKLKLHILKDGSLDSEEVVESSGNDVLDQDALQAAKTAAPYEAFTMGMDQEDLVFTVPIVYNRLISGGQIPADKVIASY
jgi:pilus assembly protein CpaC